MAILLVGSRQLPARARRAMLIGIAPVPVYFIVAAIISSATVPPAAPPSSDVPHAGMMFAEPAIKSTFVLRRTTADTEGAYVELDLLMEAGGGPGRVASHVHPDVREELRVLEGSVVISIAGED